MKINIWGILIFQCQCPVLFCESMHVEVKKKKSVSEISQTVLIVLQLKLLSSVFPKAPPMSLQSLVKCRPTGSHVKPITGTCAFILYVTPNGAVVAECRWL